MTMMMFAVVCLLLALPWHVNAFAGSSSKRVFVGTPVSNYPKHLGELFWQRKLVTRVRARYP